MLTLANILLGLLGLGIVVFFHELGHFLAARLVGIDVEAFSIGWGMPILKKTIKGVEYRLGIFPLGGYCKMKGAEDHNNEAWVNVEKGIEPEKGSYLAASPAKRILVCFAGPLFNLLFAIVLFSIIWGFGFDVSTFENRIVLASKVEQEQTFPADIAGLQTGDRILEIDGKSVSYYNEIQEIILLNPNKSMPVSVYRDGEIHSFVITPILDKSTATGRIGIYSWIDPVIDTVIEDSPAFLAGLRSGDIIKNVNGREIQNTIDFMLIRNESPDVLLIEYERYGLFQTTELNIADTGDELGFTWSIINYRTPNLSVPAAIAKGARESFRTLFISVTSLRRLFQGIDLTQAVSGPVRITYMMGEVATQGFRHGFAAALRSFFSFIALISIALCVMNLLPLPVIDGGMIILFFVEMIRGKPIPPKAVAVFQTCGIVIIFGLMALAIFGDIMFFIRM